MLHVPAVFSYIAASILSMLFVFGGAVCALEILFYWDRRSGSERQIRLERRTYLVSTIMTFVMLYELLSIFFFVGIADQIHIFFTGAMCAAGTLFANIYGYPTLILKILSFVVCSFWIALNYLDNQFEDYPLLRFKYILMLPIFMLMMGETYTGIYFFNSLDPQIITSCCGVIFDSNRIAPEIVNFPVLTMRPAFFALLTGVLCIGFYFTGTGKGGNWFGMMNLALLPVALAAIISFFCLYFYELPTHHCPFCLLQKEYHYVGYVMYLSIFTGTVLGAAVGVMGALKKYCSIQHKVPRIQKRFCIVSMAAHFIFVIIACYPMFFSEFRL